MSKKKKLIILVVTLIVLIVAMVLGFTYSKYTNSKKVSSSDTTARWSFDGALSNTNDETTTEISLAKTVSKDSIVEGKLAPGTNGSFKIIIDASGSEVDVDYDVLLKDDENNKPNNLYFTCEDLINSMENGELKKYYSLADMLAYDSATQKYNLSGTIDKDLNSSKKEIIVNWVWPYESDAREGKTEDDLDDLDTKDSGITDYNFTLNIIGKQAN